MEEEFVYVTTLTNISTFVAFEK